MSAEVIAACLAAAVVLVVVRAVVRSRWDRSVVDDQMEAVKQFWESQDSDLLIEASEIDAFLARQKKPKKAYYRKGFYFWAALLLAARLPPEIVSYEKNCREEAGRQNRRTWHARVVSATSQAFFARHPDDVMPRRRTFREALDGDIGQTWREWQADDFLAKYGMTSQDIIGTWPEFPAPIRDQVLVDTLEAMKASVESLLGERYQHLFDTVEAHPLTADQRSAVIKDEDATLVLAGAGTGKTSVVTAKVCYLIESRLAKPSEILVLAYNRKAAQELQERIGAAVKGTTPEVSTFHAAGLRILRESRRGGDVADWTNGDSLVQWLKGHLTRLLADPQYRSRAVSFVTMFGYRNPPGVDEGGEYRTLQNWMVKSKQEQAISNWLYLNGYWADYERQYAEAAVSYHPDWALGKGVYLEHFGVDRAGNTRGDIDARSYNEEMTWKRGTHAANRTTLLETFSYQFIEGTWQSALALQTRDLRRTDRSNISDFAARMLDQQAGDAASLCATFLTLMKNTGMTVDQLAMPTNGDPLLTFRAERFLDIFRWLYETYQHELRSTNSIDFADMCLLATEATRSAEYSSPYKYILVDEFQDITRSRLQMLLALLGSKPDSRLFAVGDDWQSIYRFSGGEVAIMTSEFGTYFPYHDVANLGQSFRYTPSIANLSSEFVQSNPIQITKEIEASRQDNPPAVEMRTYVGPNGHPVTDVPDLAGGLQQIAARIDADMSAAGVSKAAVLVLSRHNFRRPDADLLRPQRATVEFSTVHAAKGLEADYVVVLGMTSAGMAFPSGATDDPVLELARGSTAEMLFGEERRLFYVALTRAKQRVYLMVDVHNPSPFAIEIAEIGHEQGSVGAVPGSS